LIQDIEFSILDESERFWLRWGTSIKPPIIVGFDVVPSWLDLVVGCPHEGSVDMIIKSVQGTFCDFFDVSIGEVERI
jgi:hypothetical protein